MATMRTTPSTPHCSVSLSVISALLLPPLRLTPPLFPPFSFLSTFSVCLHPCVAFLFLFFQWNLCKYKSLTVLLFICYCLWHLLFYQKKKPSFLWLQLLFSTIPLCPSYVRWDSHWRPAEKRCTTLATLELMPPWIGSWAIWMTRVCRTVQRWLRGKKKTSATSLGSLLKLFFSVIGCRLRFPHGVAGL